MSRKNSSSIAIVSPLNVVRRNLALAALAAITLMFVLSAISPRAASAAPLSQSGNLSVVVAIGINDGWNAKLDGVNIMVPKPGLGTSLTAGTVTQVVMPSECSVFGWYCPLDGGFTQGKVHFSAKRR